MGVRTALNLIPVGLSLSLAILSFLAYSITKYTLDCIMKRRYPTVRYEQILEPTPPSPSLNRKSKSKLAATQSTSAVVGSGSTNTTKKDSNSGASIAPGGRLTFRIADDEFDDEGGIELSNFPTTTPAASSVYNNNEADSEEDVFASPREALSPSMAVVGKRFHETTLLQRLRMLLSRQSFDLNVDLRSIGGGQPRRVLILLVFLALLKKFLVLQFAFFVSTMFLGGVLFYENFQWVAASMIGMTCVLAIGIAHVLRINTNKDTTTSLAEPSSTTSSIIGKAEAFYTRLSTVVSEYFASLSRGVSARPATFYLMIGIAFGLSILLCIASWRICFCSHPYSASTFLTRTLFSTPYCTPGTICHTYLTLPENPSTEMIVQFHTKDAPKKSFIYYDTQEPPSGIKLDSSSFRYSVAARFVSMRNYTLEEPRYVSTADLTSLAPNTTYYFIAGIETRGGQLIYSSAVKKFRTLPAATAAVDGSDNNDDDVTIRFVSGGDITMGPNAQALAQHAAASDPYFAAVGGDVAYANGFRSCYSRWDAFLRFWEEMMVTPSGHSIPMLLAIGNHEGIRDFQTRHKRDAPYYMPYFSFRVWGARELETVFPRKTTTITTTTMQHLDTARKQDHDATIIVGEVHDLELSFKVSETFHYHRIGPHSSIVSLDTDVISTHEEQVPFIQRVWSSEGDAVRNRFALYHAPLYPSVRGYQATLSSNARKYWMPLFDQYNLTVGFENHDHNYKRTKCLRGNKIVDVVDNTPDDDLWDVQRQCTIYLGDGSWGTWPRKPRASDVDSDVFWYMEKVERMRHVYIVDASKDSLVVSAVNDEGAVFDAINIKT